MASLKISITGMHCGHCRQTVEQALRRVGGTWGVDVDLEGGTARVEFDPGQASPEQLVGAVVAAGYQASVAGTA